MSKVWLVAEHQFKKEVLKRGFLLTLVAMPLFLGFTSGIGWLSERMQQTTKLGYVDPANALARPAADDERALLERFASAADARTALEAGRIDGYYVLPADYPRSRRTELVHGGQQGGEADQAFQRLVRRSLLAGERDQEAARAVEGPRVMVLATARNREVPLGPPGLEQFLPLIGAMLFAFLVMTVAATLMQSMAGEKQNRTVEILVSSVSPGEMMAGKIVGVMLMALVLLASWVALLAGFAWFGASALGWDWLQGVAVPWRDLALLMLVAAPSFLCLAAAMVALGATLVDVHEAQQVGAVTFLVLLVPVYLLFVIGNEPNGVPAIAFSLFPLTAVTTLSVRSMFMEVPTAQFIAAALIALLTGVAMISLAGRLFRANMLRYGQGLRLRASLRTRA